MDGAETRQQGRSTMGHVKSRARFSILLAASLAAVAVPAIASATPQITVVAPRKGGMPAMASDAEIAGVVSAANRAEIAEAILVAPRVESTEVRAFEERMIFEHAQAE